MSFRSMYGARPRGAAVPAAPAGGPFPPVAALPEPRTAWGVGHAVITAPPAPVRRKAPHNLFTVEEVVHAVRQLAIEVAPAYSYLVTENRGGPRLEITWSNGATRRHTVDELAALQDEEDVRDVAVDWTYRDGSRVQGQLLSRRRGAGLVINGGGAARAATNACLDHLESLRPQRARWRSFVAGGGGFDLDAALLVVAVVLLVGLCIIDPAAARVDLVGRQGWQGTLAICALECLVIGWVLRRIHATTTGARLARPAVVNKVAWTSATGVVIALVTFIITSVLAVLTLLTQ